jgi:RNA polymerase sigma-70 factor (ECF subfamily)
MALMQADSLLERARAGDAAAKGKLVSLWYKRIYNFSYKFFYDHDLASEVAQKTFISMHHHLAALQEVEKFKSWLYTIAVNCCREELRRRKRRGTAISLIDLGTDREESLRWEATSARYENPERAYRQVELGDLLQQCLMELSDEQREVVIMKEYEGLKFREIAEALQVSENTVKSRMYYGLTALKEILEKRNITKETIGYD